MELALRKRKYYTSHLVNHTAMKPYFNDQNELCLPDGSKVRSFHNPAQALRFARLMQNLGYRTRFASTYLDESEVWMHPVTYWREVRVETTFQDEANAAYADLRREGGYSNV
jgi:hypothetical protein